MKEGVLLSIPISCWSFSRDFGGGGLLKSNGCAPNERAMAYKGRRASHILPLVKYEHITQ